MKQRKSPSPHWSHTALLYGLPALTLALLAYGFLGPQISTSRPARPLRQREVTDDHLEIMAGYTELYYSVHKTLPSSMAELTLAFEDLEGAAIDGWRNPLQFRIANASTWEVELRSAGPDETFSTGDDILVIARIARDR